MLIQIGQVASDNCHAGAKAPQDAAIIAERLGFRRMKMVRPLPPCSWLNLVYQVLWLVKSVYYCLQVEKKSIVFLQFPSSLLAGRLGVRFIERLRCMRRARIITLVHDVDSLRGWGMPGGKDVMDGRMRGVVGFSDVLIVHNRAMHKWFRDQGVDDAKLVDLDIFDYLSDLPVRSDYIKSAEVVIAGNLDPEKAGYLKGLNNIKDINWRLYGPGYDNSSCCDGGLLTYCGCFPPEELGKHIQGSFGLVWDGDSIETCAGGRGEYLRYNNPHKLSLYLSAGLPVIVWIESAVSELVRTTGVGLCVDSLDELGRKLRSMSVEEYEKMKMCTQRIARQLKAGCYLETALTEAVARCERGETTRGMPYGCVRQMMQVTGA